MGGVGTLTLTGQPLITFTQKKNETQQIVCCIEWSLFSVGCVGMWTSISPRRFCAPQRRMKFRTYEHNIIIIRSHVAITPKVEMTLSFSCRRVLIATKAIVDVESTLSAQNSLVARDSRSTKERNCVVTAHAVAAKKGGERWWRNQSFLLVDSRSLISHSLLLMKLARKEYRHDLPLNVAWLARVDFHKLFPTRFVACEKDKEPWKNAWKHNVECRTTTATTMELEKQKPEIHQ